MVGLMEFNVPFQHKYGYMRDDHFFHVHVYMHIYTSVYYYTMRWALVLQQYQFTIRAIKGSENVGADFLSRHSVTPDV